MKLNRKIFAIGLCTGLLATTMTFGQHKSKHYHKPVAKPRATVPARITFTATQQVQIRKSFYFLYMLERKGDTHDIVQKDAVFNTIATERATRLQTALSTCTNAACLGEALEWTPDEIRRTGDEFVQLVNTNNYMTEMVQRLKVVNRYPVYDEENDTAYIRKVWGDIAKGMNHIYEVYLQGERPRYAAIDSASIQPSDLPAVKTGLQHKMGGSFYRQSLQAALTALEVNGRDEATRYEPLYAGRNAAAFKRSRLIYWNAYKYSVILVPGAGPGKKGQSMDSVGMYRCRLAVEAYNNKLAPYIVVSGGHVHPYKTPFCEAVEMKKYLMTKLGIPDSAIIIEPHARHTTTNIRNTERLMYLFNMPATKPGLIITDPMQSLMIEKMAPRFVKEIGYVPYKEMERVDDTTNRFLPDEKAWQEDPNDPLDP
ncbi:YdcF family protein [Chitinophaga sancti]|uniref:YdcF family protein n=1 Tax=Chitinophaga sancti TaxID=1004 RepID=UPI002A7596F1|nr:YdcF family protein [Chitinophaga sancti]WPQ60766.1 YdcF family protein [Chitinophaga sancti]